MKRSFLMGLSLIALQATAANKPGDGGIKEAAQTVATKICDAMNKSDAKAFAALFTEDGRLINPAGMDGEGRANVERVFQHDLDTILKGTRCTLTIDSVRKVSPDAVWADATLTAENMRMPDGKISTGKHHVVMLLVKKGDGWALEEVRPYVFVPSTKPAAK